MSHQHLGLIWLNFPQKAWLDPDEGELSGDWTAIVCVAIKVHDYNTTAPCRAEQKWTGSHFLDGGVWKAWHN